MVNSGMSESEMTLKDTEEALEDLWELPWKLGDTERVLVRPNGLGLPSIRRCLTRSSKAISFSFWFHTFANGHSLSKAL